MITTIPSPLWEVTWDQVKWSHLNHTTYRDGLSMEMPARSLYIFQKIKAKGLHPSITAEHINWKMQCGCIAWDQREIPPCILINIWRRSIPSSSIVATFVIKDNEFAHLWCLQSSHYWWIQLLGKVPCLYSVDVSRIDRNTKRRANCWPRPWTIVPYETRLGQNSRLVRQPQMPLHILLTYASSSWITFWAVEQHKAAT